ncbi:aminotransferase class V-fold PLP-dependent enzyme [Pseudoalteromonas denitrificans]|uniref:Cysteine desulfurase n=1 Tax=Pseudoalteromonas denitrificans DSM 6059 TaxID=1123010 RepID=A0A1I1GBZ7_9GAMM|nr:SufS family cysteine desulfurase [Pseudoalteromonas denitrificans]SFC08946.1 cysteine desulfurase [Pseudoalteromonas denitrificans DSM 6059]
MCNIDILRHDFPILNKIVNDQPLIYLDSGATSQKPQCVIDSLNHFYTNSNSNVHRGIHTLGDQATTSYENTREKVAQFINAVPKEIVWTKGATESLNILAYGLSQSLKPRDIILISALEHHANIVPWQQVCAQTGAILKVIPLDETLQKITLSETFKLIDIYKPKIISLSHASNALGNIQPVKEIIEYSKKYQSITIIDGAQAFMHLRPDMKNLDCDFYVFSAHKALGPTGLGCLYGKYEVLNTLPVYQTGGEMIKTVSFEETIFSEAPSKFEAGTPNIAGVIAFGSAIDYLDKINFNAQLIYEKALFLSLRNQLENISGIKLYGDLDQNIGTISFNYKNEHPFDIATLLDQYGIAVRVGNHCTQPLMSSLNIEGTVRVSLAFYNTKTEIEVFIKHLKQCLSLLD